MASAFSDDTLGLGLDDRRGTQGMLWFIATEAALFVVFFFTYYWLGRDEPRWPNHEPPGVMLASIMLAVMIGSSAILFAGERWLAAGREGAARVALALTLLAGMAFIVLQVVEYRQHWQHLTPGTNAYGSIFYTIVTVHFGHFLLGWLMLAYVLVLPRLEPTDRPPHRPMHNVALYWYFVTLLWLAVVVVLYYLANLSAG